MVSTSKIDLQSYFNRIQQLGLIENPYAVYGDSRYFVPCTEHTTLHHQLSRYALGLSTYDLMIVQGEPGSGKTTLARRISHGIQHSSDPAPQAVYISQRSQNARALFAEIISELGLNSYRSLEEKIEVIRDYVLDLQKKQGGLVVVIDAPMNTATLKSLADLALITDDAGERLPLRIIVFGETGIFSQLSLPTLSWFSLTTVLERRAEMAGRDAPLFTQDALHELVNLSDGHIGRLIQLVNIAFDSLIDSNETVIDLFMVMDAKKELQRRTSQQ
jgi:type II secretory pathway predicted ATPase ExeA